MTQAFVSQGSCFWRFTGRLHRTIRIRIRTAAESHDPMPLSSDFQWGDWNIVRFQIYLGWHGFHQCLVAIVQLLQEFTCLPDLPISHAALTSFFVASPSLSLIIHHSSLVTPHLFVTRSPVSLPLSLSLYCSLSLSLSLLLSFCLYAWSPHGQSTGWCRQQQQHHQDSHHLQV